MNIQFIISVLLFALCNIVSLGASQHEAKEPMQVVLDNSLELALQKRTVEPLDNVGKTLSSKRETCGFIGKCIYRCVSLFIILLQNKTTKQKHVWSLV